MINLLVVDQYPIVRKGLELVFNNTQEIKFVGSTSDGEGLFNFLLKKHIDIILIEIDLPKLNGITVVRRLKSKYPKIKVIFFSTHPEAVYALSCIKAGADGYIEKTENILKIKKAIIKVINGETYLSDILNKHFKTNYRGFSSNGNQYKKLSIREVEVLKLLASGRRNKDIALELEISEKTVSTYRSRLMKKLNVTNLVDLINQSNLMEL